MSYQNNPSKARILKWITGGMEAALGIPILGGTIIVSLFWTPLVVTLVLHIVAVVLSKEEHRPITGNVLGIVTSCIGWIPIVGMIMHIITAIFILVEAGSNKILDSNP
ncbi:hypothetical protein E1H12_06355 [Geitlerinema sp. P-1104]|uniref:hypothetical protein n=1 Tax=Geitlerinema sp. P-1104 TaxID=2546230 RepID=UPI001476FF0E|nr:hypothetical protein [Geitlerinema sp. P-1104]NMG58154.1 hypothetical protein [Geitlerinema sp. P-1104]